MKAVFAIAFAMIVVVGNCYGTNIECPPTDGENVTLIASPWDCSTFFACDGGVPFLMHCNPGLLFNDNLKVCDWPDNVSCEQLATEANETL